MSEPQHNFVNGLQNCLHEGTAQSAHIPRRNLLAKYARPVIGQR